MSLGQATPHLPVLSLVCPPLYLGSGNPPVTGLTLTPQYCPVASAFLVSPALDRALLAFGDLRDLSMGIRDGSRNEVPTPWASLPGLSLALCSVLERAESLPGLGQ